MTFSIGQRILIQEKSKFPAQESSEKKELRSINENPGILYEEKRL